LRSIRSKTGDSFEGQPVAGIGACGQFCSGNDQGLRAASPTVTGSMAFMTNA
jgi:hypothetical protein